MSSGRSMFVCPGDYVDKYMNDLQGVQTGHGIARDMGGRLFVTTAGYLCRNDRHVFVNVNRGRYAPQAGDVVIGRAITVRRSGWSVDIGASVLAELPLRDIQTMDQGVVGRSDELAIRQYFEEGQLLLLQAGESRARGKTVGSYQRAPLTMWSGEKALRRMKEHEDSGVQGPGPLLHGRLRHGILLNVPHKLVGRLDEEHSHGFITYSQGSDVVQASVVVAANGAVWFSGPRVRIQEAIARSQRTTTDDPAPPIEELRQDQLILIRCGVLATRVLVALNSCINAPIIIASACALMDLYMSGQQQALRNASMAPLSPGAGPVTVAVQRASMAVVL